VSADMVAGTIAGAVLRAQPVLQDLRLLTGLREAAEALAAACASSGSPTLVAASPEGAALVGAAVALGGGQVQSASIAGAAIGKAMVVDAVAVSGLAVRRSVDALRAAGADWVGVFVWKVASAGDSRPPAWGDVDQLLIAG
jgi:hypothetical protein